MADGVNAAVVLSVVAIMVVNTGITQVGQHVLSDEGWVEPMTQNLTPAETHRRSFGPYALRARIHPGKFLESVGFALAFCWNVLSAIPLTPHYRRQTISTITDMTWGRGSLIVGGGTAPVMLIMGAAIGASIGIRAYTALELVSLGPVSKGHLGLRQHP